MCRRRPRRGHARCPVLVDASAGVFAETRGHGLVLTLAVAALAVALVGVGKVSVDKVLFGRSNSKLRVLA